jgi:hypothetical protein
MSVSSDVNAFTREVNLKLNNRIRFASTGRTNLIDSDNGFSLNIPCIQKVFKLYARFCVILLF